MLSEAERTQAVADVRALIVGSGQRATVWRAVPGERLFGSDAAGREMVGEVAIELLPDPPEDLGQKVDATASLLPDADVRTEDHLVIDGETYRVQSLQPERLFGAVTHVVAALVRVHAR
jgi:hypothetical protein